MYVVTEVWPTNITKCSKGNLKNENTNDIFIIFLNRPWEMSTQKVIL